MNKNKYYYILFVFFLILFSPTIYPFFLSQAEFLSTPLKEAPSQEAPSQEAPSQEAPSQEAPSQEAPSKESPPNEGFSNSSLSSTSTNTEAVKEVPWNEPPTNLIGPPMREPDANKDSLEDIAEEDLGTSLDTPVSHDEIQGDIFLTKPRKWRAPDFSNQDQALGYEGTTFEVPVGLEKNFYFWLDIYSKYTTDQGLVHDSENIDLIYEVLDFSDISSRTDLNPIKKELLKKRAVKNSKSRIITLLKKLHKIKSPISLTPEEKRIWDYFDNIKGKSKFLQATNKNRIRFQLGQRDRVIQGIYFSGRYLEEFERIFRDEDLPIELTRLPFVESSFNVMARSKVGASGLWQIMRVTARPYVMMNDAIDKRNHPSEATRLAAKLLKINYKILRSWPLAITGWNHGPTGILKLTKLHRTRELGALGKEDKYSRKKLGFASRNFYPSFLAILEVEKKAPFYFGNVTWSKTLDSESIRLKKNIFYSHLLQWFEDDDHKAQIFNPHISTSARLNKIPIPKGAVVSIPSERGKSTAELLQEE